MLDLTPVSSPAGAPVAERTPTGPSAAGGSSARSFVDTLTALAEGMAGASGEPDVPSNPQLLPTLPALSSSSEAVQPEFLPGWAVTSLPEVDAAIAEIEEASFAESVSSGDANADTQAVAAAGAFSTAAVSDPNLTAQQFSQDPNPDPREAVAVRSSQGTGNSDAGHSGTTATGQTQLMRQIDQTQLSQQTTTASMPAPAVTAEAAAPVTASVIPASESQEQSAPKGAPAPATFRESLVDTAGEPASADGPKTDEVTGERQAPRADLATQRFLRQTSGSGGEATHQGTKNSMGDGGSSSARSAVNPAQNAVPLQSDAAVRQDGRSAAVAHGVAGASVSATESAMMRDSSLSSGFTSHEHAPNMGTTVAPGKVTEFAAALAATSSQDSLPAGTTNQIVQAIRMQWARGGGEAHIRLDPRQFGDMTVSLRVDQGQVVARLQADAPAVREWLQTNQGLLRHSLSEQNLTLDRLEVSEPREPRDGDRRERQQAPPREEQQKQRRRRPDTGDIFDFVA